jgi:NAD(P)-dependent dehydrogenase (short-subunit alcohol dehydrogenase family)
MPLDDRLEDITMSRTWFVTGANSGMGAGTAKAALAAGDRVVATGRNLDKLAVTFAGYDDSQLALIQLDVTDEAQARAAISAAVERFGSLDILVNNAGYNILGAFEALSKTDFEQQFATNFYGVVNVMRAALPTLRKQRSGHIINISSVGGVVGFKHCAAYSATKFAVEGLSLSVAAEVEPFGIHMTIVEPGFFRTELLSASNAQFAETDIGDYAADGSARDMWSGYNGTQTGDPDRLGEALVTISRMDQPLKLFVAGSDALAGVIPAVEQRLEWVRAAEDLSRSTDGNF